MGDHEHSHSAEPCGHGHGNAAPPAESHGHGHAEKRTAEEEQSSLDSLLMQAEAEWQKGDHDIALTHYDTALEMLRQSGDTDKEGMVCMGKGFALVNINQFKKAAECLERAEEIARLSGNDAQASFVATFVASTRARALEEEGVETAHVAADPLEAAKSAAEDAIKTALAAASVQRFSVLLVLEGSPKQTECDGSKTLVAALETVKLKFEYIDVASDDTLQEAFKEVARGSLSAATAPQFPMLYVSGSLLPTTIELSAEDLEAAVRARLTEDGRAPETIDEMFTAEVHDCADNGCGGAHHDDEHREKVQRAVEQCLVESGIDPAELSLGEEEAANFVKQLSAHLGGFELPEDLMVKCSSTAQLVEYVLDNCEAEGDCNKCPIKDDCKAHVAGHGQPVDIEEMAACEKEKAAEQVPARKNAHVAIKQEE